MSEASFVTAIPSSLLVDSVIIIRATMMACIAPMKATAATIDKGWPEREKKNSTTNVIITAKMAGIPNRDNRYPNFPRGVIEKCRATLSSIYSMAKMMMETINNMLIAQLEIEKKEKRQREGIASKKNRGEWDDYGRPAAIDYKQFAAAYARVKRGEIGPTNLRRELGLSHSTFYRYRAQYLKNNP